MDVKQVAAFIAENLAYDEVILMERFDEILGVTLPKSGELSQIQAAQIERMAVIDQVAKELLKSHSLMLKNVRGEGYKLVVPAQQTKVAMAEGQHKIKKELTKAVRRVTCVRTDELDSAQQREREDALAKLKTIHKMVKGK